MAQYKPASLILIKTGTLRGAISLKSMNVSSATGSTPVTPQYDNKPFQDLVRWHQRIVKELPSCRYSKPNQASLLRETEGLYHGELPEVDKHSFPSDQSIYSRLKAINTTGAVRIYHQELTTWHAIDDCSPSSCSTKGYIHFYPVHQENCQLPPRANITLFFHPDNWLDIADLLFRLAKDPAYESQANGCKLALPAIYTNSSTPAIIYLQVTQPSDTFLEKLKSEACRLPLQKCALAGAREIHSGVWLTALNPIVSGCQPESRRHILIASFYLGIPATDSESSICKAAELLGYQPDEPDKLQSPTSSLLSLQHFLETFLIRNYFSLEDLSDREKMADLAMNIRHKGKINQQACQQRLEQLSSNPQIKLASPNGDTLAPCDFTKNGFKLSMIPPQSSNPPETKQTQLTLSIKPEHFHKLLQFLSTEPLTERAKHHPWSLEVDSEKQYTQTPTPVRLTITGDVSSAKKAGIALKQYLGEHAFFDIKLYEGRSNPDWADLPGQERVSRGISMATPNPLEESDSNVFADHLAIAMDALFDSRCKNNPMPLKDILAIKLFEAGYQMHNPSTSRPDLNVLEVQTMIRLWKSKNRTLTQT